MKKTAPVFALLCAAGACAGNPGADRSTAGELPETDSADRAEPAADVPPTRYRVGDSITYVYTGTFTEEPVRMVERVTNQEGNHLRIEVTLTRGDETRQWIQVLTDTPENQRNDVIDELWEVVDGETQQLQNEGNADIYRLADWTLLDGIRSLNDSSEEEVTVEIAGESLGCVRESSTTTWEERTLRFVRHTCEGFLWTNGPATFVDSETEEVIWSVDVVDVSSAPR